jgi:hypothetical protein
MKKSNKTGKMQSIKQYIVKELLRIVPGFRVEIIKEEIKETEEVHIKISKNPENKMFLIIRGIENNENKLSLHCIIENNNKSDMGHEKILEIDDKIKINLLKEIEKILKKSQFLNNEIILKLNRKMVILKEFEIRK